MKDKNIIDKFLDYQEEQNQKKYVTLVDEYRPKKHVSIFGFVVSVLFLFGMVFFCTKKLTFGGVLLLIGALFATVYYGLNLFTKNGFVINKKYIVEEEVANQILGNDEEEEEKEL